jgi:hypothetical protein
MDKDGENPSLRDLSRLEHSVPALTTPVDHGRAWIIEPSSLKGCTHVCDFIILSSPVSAPSI